MICKNRLLMGLRVLGRLFWEHDAVCAVCQFVRYGIRIRHVIDSADNIIESRYILVGAHSSIRPSRVVRGATIARNEEFMTRNCRGRGSFRPLNALGSPAR